MTMSSNTPKVFFSSYRPPQLGGGKSGQFKQLSIVVLIVVGGYFLTRLPIFQIKNIEITGSDDSKVIEEVNSLRGQSILSGTVERKIDNILASNPEIISLDCDKGLPNTLLCRSRLRQATFVWQTANEQFLMDETGVVFKVITGSLSQPLIIDKKGLPVKPGDQPMSEEVVKIFQTLYRSLADQSFVIGNFFVDTSALHPGVVIASRKDGKVFTTQELIVLFSASYPTDIQVKLLDKLLTANYQKITQYIDLRAPGYIYYK